MLLYSPSGARNILVPGGDWHPSKTNSFQSVSLSVVSWPAVYTAWWLWDPGTSQGTSSATFSQTWVKRQKSDFTHKGMGHESGLMDFFSRSSVWILLVVRHNNLQEPKCLCPGVTTYRWTSRSSPALVKDPCPERWTCIIMCITALIKQAYYTSLRLHKIIKLWNFRCDPAYLQLV